MGQGMGSGRGSSGCRHLVLRWRRRASRWRLPPLNPPSTHSTTFIKFLPSPQPRGNVGFWWGVRGRGAVRLREAKMRPINPQNTYVIMSRPLPPPPALQVPGGDGEGGLCLNNPPTGCKHPKLGERGTPQLIPGVRGYDGGPPNHARDGALR